MEENNFKEYNQEFHWTKGIFTNIKQFPTETKKSPIEIFFAPDD